MTPAYILIARACANPRQSEGLKKKARRHGLKLNLDCIGCWEVEGKKGKAPRHRFEDWERGN